MIHLKIECHANQYQGCAWGHHHSEGVVDWPPAPWRLLRAIAAGYYNAKVSEKYLPTLKAVMHKLASVLPSYTLPPVTYIQHRSPRPQVEPKDATVAPGKTLYSAGLRMSSDRNLIYIHWEIELSDAEQMVLEWCLSGVTYLGRREAAATVSLIDDCSEQPNAQPDSNGDRIVTIADSSLAPDALWDAINLSAHENYGVNRSAVFPGVQQAIYSILQPVVQRNPPSDSRVKQVVLSVSGNPRFPMKQCLKLTQRLHRLLVSCCPSPMFTGMEMGQPRTDHHHTIFQCVPDRTGRYVEQVRLYCHTGYDRGELAAIANSRYLKGVAGGYDVSLALVDFGNSVLEGRDWESCTPFFLTRCPAVRRGKPRMLTESFQKDGPEHQVLQYLRYLPWLNLTDNSLYQEYNEGLALMMNDEIAVVVWCQPFQQFWEWESECSEGKKVGRVGYWARLRFSRLVLAPIMFGYAAHFGLGQCRAIPQHLAKQSVEIGKMDESLTPSGLG